MITSPAFILRQLSATRAASHRSVTRAMDLASARLEQRARLLQMGGCPQIPTAILIQKRRPVGGDANTVPVAASRKHKSGPLPTPRWQPRRERCRSWSAGAESRLGAHVPAAWPLSARYPCDNRKGGIERSFATREPRSAPARSRRRGMQWRYSRGALAYPDKPVAVWERCNEVPRYLGILLATLLTVSALGGTRSKAGGPFF